MPLASMLPPIVFFDAVGTLLHPEPPAPVVYADVGHRFGSRLDETVIAQRFREAFHRQEQADYAAGLRTSEEREWMRWKAIVAEVLDDVSDPEGCFAELHSHFARADAWRCEPHTSDVLETLASRGHRPGIASNFDARLRQVVTGLPDLRHARELVISSEIGWRKPAPSFFAEMCQRSGSPPGQVVYVGDDESNDYEGGRAFGLQVVLLSPTRRASVPPEAVITSLMDLV
jgi:putative hydrolase of the HAD superfamily